MGIHVVYVSAIVYYELLPAYYVRTNMADIDPNQELIYLTYLDVFEYL